jgi:hypothetical protein
MPFKSKSQQRWAHSKTGTKALGGADKVREWDESTETQKGGFKKLPNKVRKKNGR